MRRANRLSGHARTQRRCEACVAPPALVRDAIVAALFRPFKR
jgi:hypothetical protein